MSTRVNFNGSSDHPDWNCPNCRECESCDGGSGVTSDRYRLIPFPGTDGKVLSVRCADCDGEGLICNCQCHVIAAAEATR